MATKTLTVKEVAETLGTDGRTLRKFLRSEVKESGGTVGVDTPGKGKRYSIPAGQVKGLTKRFNAWNEAKAAKPEVEEVTDEIESPETEDAELEITLD